MCTTAGWLGIAQFIKMRIDANKILIDEYSYDLPDSRIAEFPVENRGNSRLLIYENAKITDAVFNELPNHIPGEATLILNNTRVIPARIFFTKATGGLIEIFCLEPYQSSMDAALQKNESVVWKCMIGGASKWKHGQVLMKEIEIEGNKISFYAKWISKDDESFIIEFSWTPSHYFFAQLLSAAGAIPLPPYIKRSAEGMDTERYQTIFGKPQGSVAAPTAALHFTHNVFDKLSKKNISYDYVTLHVGAGTFKPVKSETIAGHCMHGEVFYISKKTIQLILQSKKIIATGTTSLRTLESIHWLGIKLINGLIENEWELGQWEAYELDDSINYKTSLLAIINWMDQQQLTQINCRTSLLIVPGYSFKISCGLITNFHQPQSTLLLLIAAFIGKDWKKIYNHALKNGYQFLSYGDSSLLWRND